MSARIPDVVDNVVTEISASNVIIRWSAPYNGGNTISSYTIRILQGDGVTYSTSLVSCNGANAAVIASASCTVPISNLLVSPFNLPWGSSIFATVTATNTVGTSAISQAGNGAIILTNPDPPQNVINVPQTTTAF